jgi:hypothetical protein
VNISYTQSHSLSHQAKFWDRGVVPRRLKSASFALTMRSFSQAGHLGGLPRASPVPFRGMLLTRTERPASLSPNGSLAS